MTNDKLQINPSALGRWLLVLAILMLIIPNNVYSQDEEWNVFAGRFCTVFYEKDVDLKLVNSHIILNFSDFYSPRQFREKPDLSIENILAGKFDAIFNRVEEVLDMYPTKLHLTINIYKSRENLDIVYEQIFDEPNVATSFYIYKTNTIYTTESNINENILAHEIAHSIIDHYFVILPPRKVQEILAVYADVHLNGEEL